MLQLFVGLPVQVLLEAQEMAVKNYNVEYKSNLYVGKFLQLWWVFTAAGWLTIKNKLSLHYKSLFCGL